MKTVLNAVLVAALAMVCLRGFGVTLGESADGGAAVRKAYLAAYDVELKKAAGDFHVRMRSGEFNGKGSLAVVQAWAKVAAAAGKKASADVTDPVVAEVAAWEDFEKQCAWVEEFSK